MDFNPEALAIGGVQLIALVFGLVEFIKANTPISGKAVTWLSFGLGAVLYLALNLDAFLPGAGRFVTLAVQMLTVGLAASGYYKFLSERMLKL